VGRFPPTMLNRDPPSVSALGGRIYLPRSAPPSGEESRCDFVLLALPPERSDGRGGEGGGTVSPMMLCRENFTPPPVSALAGGSAFPFCSASWGGTPLVYPPPERWRWVWWPSGRNGRRGAVLTHRSSVGKVFDPTPSCDRSSRGRAPERRKFMLQGPSAPSPGRVSLWPAGVTSRRATRSFRDTRNFSAAKEEGDRNPVSLRYRPRRRQWPGLSRARSTLSVAAFCS
jgi:hypothetical protein